MRSVQYYSCLILLFIYSFVSQIGGKAVFAFVGVTALLTLVTLIYDRISLLSLGSELWRYLAFVLFAIVSGEYLCVFRETYLSNSVLILEVFVFVFMFTVASTYRKSALPFLDVYAVASSILLFIRLFQMGFHISTDERLSILGEGSTTNGFSHLLVLIFIVALNWLIQKGLIKKILSVIIMCTSLYVIIASASRKSIVALVIGVFLWYFLLLVPKYMKDKSVVKKLVPVIFFVIILIAGLYVSRNLLSGSLLQERFKILESEMKDNDFVRTDMIKEGFLMFKQKPLFGNGLGQYMHLASFDNHYSHCDVIEILANHGIVGFLLYYMIYITLIFKLFKFQHKKKSSPKVDEARLLLIIMIIFTFIGFGTVYLINFFAWIIFATIMGFTNTMYKNS